VQIGKKSTKQQPNMAGVLWAAYL